MKAARYMGDMAMKSAAKLCLVFVPTLRRYSFLLLAEKQHGFFCL